MPIDSPLIVAHRGLHRGLPENSLSAFELAIREGFTSVECDVHASKDGKPVIHHDDALDRTTTGSGPVANRSIDQLGELRLRDAEGHATGQAISSLRDAVIACGPELHWLVEIKPPDAKRLVKEVIEVFAARPRQLTIQSFDAANLVHALTLDGRLPVALLVEDESLIGRAIEDRWPSIYLDHRLLNEEVAESMRRHGLRIGAWTVNDAPDIARMLAMGIDTIITDEPWRVRYAIEDKQTG